MWTHLAITLFLFFTQYDTSFLPNVDKAQIAFGDNFCKTQIDSLTNKIIYTTADILPTNEGGKGALMKKLERGISADIAIESDFDGSIIVAFIVDVDGSIKGERIVKDKTNMAGQQMLDIVKTFKWAPAICKGKKIAMLYTLTTCMYPAEN